MVNNDWGHSFLPIDAKPLPEPIKKQFTVNWKPIEKFQWSFSQNTLIFIKENASENVIW